VPNHSSGGTSSTTSEIKQDSKDTWLTTKVKSALAADVGLPLFERIGRRTYLTPAGSEMLSCANAITERLREAESALAQLKGVKGGRLNVAVISAGDYFFPRVLATSAEKGAGIPELRAEILAACEIDG